MPILPHLSTKQKNVTPKIALMRGQNCNKKQIYYKTASVQSQPFTQALKMLYPPACGAHDLSATGPGASAVSRHEMSSSVTWPNTQGGVTLSLLHIPNISWRINTNIFWCHKVIQTKETKQFLKFFIDWNLDIVNFCKSISLSQKYKKSSISPHICIVNLF